MADNPDVKFDDLSEDQIIALMTQCYGEVALGSSAVQAVFDMLDDADKEVLYDLLDTWTNDRDEETD